MRGKLADRPPAKSVAPAAEYTVLDCGDATCTTSVTAGERHCITQSDGAAWDVLSTTSSTTTT